MRGSSDLFSGTWNEQNLKNGLSVLLHITCDDWAHKPIRKMFTELGAGAVFPEACRGTLESDQTRVWTSVKRWTTSTADAPCAPVSTPSQCACSPVCWCYSITHTHTHAHSTAACVAVNTVIMLDIKPQMDHINTNTLGEFGRRSWGKAEKRQSECGGLHWWNTVNTEKLMERINRDKHEKSMRWTLILPVPIGQCLEACREAAPGGFEL